MADLFLSPVLVVIVDNRALRIWLSKLKEVDYEAETLLLLFSVDSLPNVKYADKVKEILHALEMAADEGLRFNLNKGNIVHRESDGRLETSSFFLDREVFGREREKVEIVKLLLSSETTTIGGEAQCIPIVGMGGLGKTTLAQLAYNDHEVRRHFDFQVWVFVSDQFDVKNIMRTVIHSLSKDNSHYPTLDTLYLEVRGVLQNKRYLIVLDDVWTENPDDWDKLRPLFTAGIDGSKMLITARSKKVALLANSPNSMYCLKELSKDACWSLFVQRAFPQGDKENHPDLLPIGEQIVSKCGGVALAIKALGSLLKPKRSVREWEIIRDSELWNLDESEN
ncbi:Putative disease resistance protein RGA3 [Morus notabilis]|uniref:Putative disease resistance protein RGA3 n=1 Tax=Morus notabilis TaxID=981085 RepID=W9R1J7_9ROSA|nr:putative disease resistance protein RGA3 [Morus notabilis]EXB51444.1 Putative disease resistance protein RGA3 [Morus notabilis]